MIETTQVGLLTTATEQGTSCPLLGVHVEGDIIGRVARMEVTQAFRNPHSKPLEAVYRFPLSEGATLYRFRAKIGDRELEGEVEEREKAFDKYDRALEEGHGGYLLDEERPNIFTASVGNLPPNAEAVLTVGFVEVLETVDGSVRFRLPTSISPRYVPDDYDDGNGVPLENQIHPSYADDVPYGLTFRFRLHGADSIQSVESPSHPIRTRFEEGSLVVETVSDSVRMDSDFVLLVKRADLNQLKAWSSVHGDELFLQVDVPHLAGGGEEPGAKDDTEVFFVLDASGSMQGSSYEQAKRALQIMLKALPQRARFNILRFGSTYESLWESARPATSENVKEAVRYLQRSTADLGGTEMLRPLRAIYSKRPGKNSVRNVVLLTDGQIGNEKQVIKLAGSARGQIRLFTVGIGNGPNDYLIRETARVSGAESVIIPPGEQIEPPILRLFGYLWGRPYERIQLDLSDAEQAPRSPVVYPGRTVSVFARLPVDSEANLTEVRVTADSGEETLQWTVPLERLDPKASPLPQLWAREAIRELEESGSGGSRQEQRRASSRRNRAIEISRKYGVLCQNTSFLIIEKREGRGRIMEEIVLQKVPAPVTRDWHGGAFFYARRLSREMDREAAAHATLPQPGEELLYARESLVAEEAFPHRAAYQDVAAQTSPLLEILAAQRPDGGFDPEDDLLNRLNLDPDELAVAADALALGDRDLALRVVFTALVLAILEQWYSEDRDTWATIVTKSKAWLRDKLTEKPVSVGGKSLQAWADELVKTLKRPRS